VTGDIGIDEVAWVGDELWFVSRRFSCLAALDPDYSFVPRWQPPFITAIAAEDRCHLNGLAIVDGKPKYVTALGTTDVRDGWRPDKPHGGCIIDIPSGEFVARGLSMPHSPRYLSGQLWVLESGTDGVLLVDQNTGCKETVVELPGFTRGLVLAGDHAFVGLSKIRATSAMNGVPIAERREQLKCGVAAVDLRRGRIAGMLEFQTAVEEIFDVQLPSGTRFPEIVGFQKETVDHTFIIPRRCETDSTIGKSARRCDKPTQGRFKGTLSSVSESQPFSRNANKRPFVDTRPNGLSRVGDTDRGQLGWNRKQCRPHRPRVFAKQLHAPLSRWLLGTIWGKHCVRRARGPPNASRRLGAFTAA